MANIFITSDTHFHHENIIKYCNRPFNSIYDMDETLIKNWNSVIKPQDKVYHLGDVYFPQKEKSDYLFSRLNGTKRLILGNHDNGKDQTLHKYFKEIYMWRFLKEFGLLLTHVPVHPSSLSEKLKYNVHGHIHNKPAYSRQYKNVSVEMTNYTPVAIEDLV